MSPQLFNQLNQRNISAVVSNNVHAKYRISNGIKQETTPYDFLYNEEEYFLIYSKNGKQVSICPVESSKMHLILFALCVTVAVAALLFAYKTSKYEFNNQSSVFWFFGEDVDEDRFNTLHPIDKYFLIRSFRFSKNYHQIYTGVTSVHRHSDRISYSRVANIPLDEKNFFVFTYQETPEPPSEMGIEIKFHSDALKLMNGPTIDTFNFRRYYPINISFELDRFVHGIIKCPVSIIEPFQPYGQFVHNSISLISHIAKLIGEHPYFQKNFNEAIELISHHINANRALCYSMKNRLLYQYTIPGLEPLQIDVANEIGSKIPGKPIEQFTNDLLSDGSLAYIQLIKIDEIFFSIVFTFNEPPKSQLMKSLGSSLMAGTAIFIYQLAHSKEESLRLKNFYGMISNTMNYAFFEIVSDLSHILFFNSKINGLDIDFIKRIINPENNLMPKEEQFLELLKEASTSADPIKQRIIEMRQTSFNWLSFSSQVTISQSYSKPVLTIFIEEITEMKGNKSQLEHIIADMDRAWNLIGLHKFDIKDLTLLTSQVPEILHRDPNERRLRVLVDPQDSYLLDEMKAHHMKCNIKLLDANQQPIWFSITTNDNIGFLFCVNDLFANLTNQFHPKVDKSNLIIWSIDITDESVHPLSGFPTIWDYLSVEKNCEFSRFINFLPQDQRDMFITNYSYLMKGTMQTWSCMVQILKIGEKYEWHRVALVRSSNNYLYCIALNINKEQLEFEQLLDELTEKDKTSKMSKSMIWLFQDTKEPSKKKPAVFTEGIYDIMEMNWHYIDQFVLKSDQQEFKKRMTASIKKNIPFEMAVSFEFTPGEYTHLIMNGRYCLSISKMLGICVEVNDIYEQRLKELTDLQKLVEKREAKMSDAKSSYHQFLCTFNDICGIIDFLFADAKTKQQLTILRSIDTATMYVMNYATKPFEDYQLKSSSKNFELFDDIEITAQTFYSYAKRNGMEIKFTLKGDFPDYVVGDQSIINFIFCILCSYILGTPVSVVEFTLKMETNFVIEVATETPTDHMFIELINILESGSIIVIEDTTKQEYVESKAFIFTCSPQFLRFEFPLSCSASGTTPMFKRQTYPAFINVKDQSIYKQIEYVVKDELGVELIDFSSIDELQSRPASFIFADQGNNELPIIHKIAENSFENKPLVCVVTDAGVVTSYQATLYKPLIVAQLRSFIRQYIDHQSVSHNLFKSVVHADMIKRHVLIVEDNKTNQFVMMKLLDTIGCTYDVAENGEAALQKLDEQTFDIVFMDFWLPILDGAATTKIVRKSPKPYASIPIIGISAVPNSQEECIKAGMSAFYLKPIRIHHVKDALTRFYQTS